MRLLSFVLIHLVLADGNHNHTTHIHDYDGHEGFEGKSNKRFINYNVPNWSVSVHLRYRDPIKSHYL